MFQFLLRLLQRDRHRAGDVLAVVEEIVRFLPAVLAADLRHFASVRVIQFDRDLRGLTETEKRLQMEGNKSLRSGDKLAGYAK